MTDLVDKVRRELAKLTDPGSKIPLIFLDGEVDIRLIDEGYIHVTYIARDPYSPKTFTYADAVKKIASKVEGVKKVVVEVRNHIMMDYLNLMLNS